ncbi:MAG: hypothetical protein LBP43_07835 [Treponema sp.]|nr:hypothetical protein [Treponema sp.]
MRTIYPGPFLLGCFLLLSLLPLAALDLPTGKIEDDSSLRISLKDSWFTEIPGKVMAGKGFLHTLPGGARIQVRAETGGEEFMIILAREWNGSYPGWAQGSWILTRRRDDGSPSRIRIFLRSDPNTYIQFRPLGKDRSQLDLVLYDGYILRALPVPFSLERLLVMPVEEVLASLGTKFPRRYFDPNPDWYGDLRSFMEALRERLPELTYRDDGAIDEKGRYVFINTLEGQGGTGGLNCSGFAKWVVDGILRPVTGERLPVQPLKEPFGERGSSLTDPYEKLRDPFFGLDWTRNLAARAGGILRSPAFGRLEEIEVQRTPFSQVILRNKDGSLLRSYPGFLKNAGFGVEGLQPLLYTLAIDEPGRIYLASVNDEIGPAPRMRQHFHVAVLVPYFNEYGNFRIAVFESAAETSFSQFKNRYPGHYVNLVRIPVEPSFDP